MNSTVVLALYGATAVGKSALLARLVDRFGDRIEIIVADSRQVYRGFIIGTAAPGEAERAAVPHHLVGTVDPRTPFNVGRFVAAAERAVEEIHRRGHLPVLVGGTGYYLGGYLAGLPSTPPSDPAIREAIQRGLERDGLAALRARLAQVDPTSESRIAANDAYRVMRALEVYRVSGRPLSSFRRPGEVRAGLDARLVVLRRPRAELVKRIDARVDRMIAAGLPGEVAAHLESGLTADAPAMRTIGYREFCAVGPPPWSRDTLDEVGGRIAVNTRRYARRQITYENVLPNTEPVDADDAEAIAAVLTERLARLG